MANNKRIVSIIVSCLNEEENIEEMYDRVKAVFSRLSSYDFELLYVDNDSLDTSHALYKKLGRRDRRVKAIIMSRNFGSPQPSFLAGLTYMKGHAAVLLHGDIQDPPEMIRTFIQKWEEGYEVVYGVRNRRKGYGFVWNASYKAFYWLLQKLAYIHIPLDAGDFSLIDIRVVEELLKLDEYEYYIRCLRAYVGFRQIGVRYIRDARAHGRSNESFITSLWWAKTIILNYSFKPLTLISYLGFFVTLVSFVFIFINLYLVLVLGQRTPGAPTIVIVVLLLGGIQLLSLSLIAEYVSRIFLEVKHRTRYIVRETINL